MAPVRAVKRVETRPGAVSAGARPRLAAPSPRPSLPVVLLVGFDSGFPFVSVSLSARYVPDGDAHVVGRETDPEGKRSRE